VEKSDKYCTHWSRLQVEQVQSFQNAALISVRDPGREPALFARSTFHEVLLLEFDDVSCSDELFALALGSGYLPPVEEHAQEIVRFVRQHANRTIIAQCEMGISRSAAICAFLVEQGWRYEAAGEGLGAANQRLLSLLRREIQHTGGWT